MAALTCALIFEKGHRIAALGLKFRPNRWWMVALVLPMAMDAYHMAVMAALGRADADTSFADPHKTIAAVFKLRPEALPHGYIGIAGIVILIAFGFSIMFTLTEEMGWRGYLYQQCRPLGFWRYSLLTGLVWGVWHWPMVIYFGLVFSDHRLAGLVYYPLETMSLAPIMTLLRDRGRSIWAPGIFHGMANTIGIILFDELGRNTKPEFLPLLLMLPSLLLVELFRRIWPERVERAETPETKQPVRNSILGAGRKFQGDA